MAAFAAMCASIYKGRWVLVRGSAVQLLQEFWQGRLVLVCFDHRWTTAGPAAQLLQKS